MKPDALRNIDSILFDLDGTLWDASASCTKAWNEALKQSGWNEHRVDEATIRSFSGLRIERVFQKYFHFIPEEKHSELFRYYRHHENEVMQAFGGSLFPGVKETLTTLREHYPLFIVSNCLAGYIENFLEFHGLQHLFTDYESSGNTGLAKYENIELLIRRNGLKNPVYVGDTVWDCEAAEKAGVPFIFAGYGFGKVENSIWALSGFSELRELIP